MKGYDYITNHANTNVTNISFLHEIFAFNSADFIVVLVIHVIYVHGRRTAVLYQCHATDVSAPYNRFVKHGGLL